jgi:predicted naringenin-chalcone synthase
LSKIISISTSVPTYKHKQEDLFAFADKVYSKNETDSRKLKFLYRQSSIAYRYSVAPDFTNNQSDFFPNATTLEPFPSIEDRMQWYNKNATTLSVKAIEDCIKSEIAKGEITHLITVSCTGMSAPGLDLQIIEAMDLPKNIIRTSVNFMGCYAAIHALKIADAFCSSTPKSNIIIVCTELCTLHFQKEISADNITASLLFGDGCAAVLLQNDDSKKGLHIDSFFADVSFKGKKDMAWELSSTGFLMTLTGYIPDLIKADFKGLVDKVLQASEKKLADISHWCIHPGGKKILDNIAVSMNIDKTALQNSYTVLRDYGNMSSPTILFVLKKILDELKTAESKKDATIFAAAFGPGLTMETFTATYV